MESGAEPGVVEHDIGRVHACGNQILPHRHRLVIALQRVIAAQQQVVYLAAVVGVQRALNAVAIILVDHPCAVILGGAEHHAHLTVGEILQVIKDGAVFQLIQRSRPSTINSSMPTRQTGCKTRFNMGMARSWMKFNSGYFTRPVSARNSDSTEGFSATWRTFLSAGRFTPAGRGRSSCSLTP